MHCSGCGSDNPPDSNFCEDCGSKLEASCLSCHGPITPGKNYCRHGGFRLAGPDSPDVADAGGDPSPETYTPRHLADRILSSRAAIEGERKQVTVLFADIKGSTQLIADLDPEQVSSLFDPTLKAMMDAVHAHDGTVNKVQGDGVMALFGAPLAHEDHAVRACNAAIDMLAAAKEIAENAWDQLRKTNVFWLCVWLYAPLA